MSDPLLLQQKKFLLEKLRDALNGRLTKAKVKVPKAVQKKLKLDDLRKQMVLDELVQEQQVAKTKAGSSFAYQLTQVGQSFLQTMQPPPVDMPDELAAYRKSFVLLQLLRSSERRLTRSKLNDKFRSKTAEPLAFMKLADETSTGDVVVDDLVVEEIIARLARMKAVTVRKIGHGRVYELTKEGEEELGALSQFPTASFTLTGEELNALCEAVRTARSMGELRATTQEQPHEESAIHQGHQEFALTGDMVLKELEVLKNERYTRDGIVPIHELRAKIETAFGPGSARHDMLDPILKQLRSENRLRMIAICDLTDTTSQQLDDSVPGENETFFYVEAAHEPAYAE